VSKTTKRHCAGTAQTMGGIRKVFRRERKTATESAEVTCKSKVKES